MSLFICPHCNGTLSPVGKSYQCPQRHTYDISAEGYIYLLEVNQKHSKIPGDTKEMVRSRREFLEKGYYKIFSDTLNQLAFRLLNENPSPILLDAGCGEGYYTRNLKEYLTKQGISSQMAGIDISKPAIRLAAKKSRDIEFAVGSLFHLPVASHTADLLINIFAPIVPEEFRRVTKKGGYLIIAVPGPRHLFSLKEALYDAPYENEYKDTVYEGFRLVDRIPVQSEIELSEREDILRLFTMTPYYWKTPKEGAIRLHQQTSLTTQIHFDFLVYQACG